MDTPAAKRPKTASKEEEGEDTEKDFVVVAPAYKRAEFLSSNEGRPIRILCELEHTRKELEEHGITSTVLFFASARGKSRAKWQESVDTLTAALAREGLTSEERASLESSLARTKRLEWQCDVYVQCKDLAARLAAWGVDRAREHGKPEVSICTGGGPGMMEAANEGASSVEGASSIGMGIQLPFESGLNKFVTPELAFNYHYFFTRKFWMSYPAKALVVAPGGFGTCDELFEILTLIQTQKMDKIPIVLLGKTFWQGTINWNAMRDHGVIGENDVDLMFFTDSVDEAYEYVTSRIEADESG